MFRARLEDKLERAGVSRGENGQAIAWGTSRRPHAGGGPRVSFRPVTSISTSASIVIPRPREEVFAFATDSTNAPQTIRSRGPFAGISKIEMYEGQSLAKGSKRRIFMTNGAVLEEVILDYDPPLRHRYGWTGGVKPPYPLLVRSGSGNWDFTETDGGTRIVWTYTFALTSPLAYPLAIAIAWLFKGWLQQGLNAMRTELLAQPSPRAVGLNESRPSA